MNEEETDVIAMRDQTREFALKIEWENNEEPEAYTNFRTYPNSVNHEDLLPYSFGALIVVQINGEIIPGIQYNGYPCEEGFVDDVHCFIEFLERILSVAPARGELSYGIVDNDICFEVSCENFPQIELKIDSRMDNYPEATYNFNYYDLYWELKREYKGIIAKLEALENPALLQHWTIERFIKKYDHLYASGYLEAYLSKDLEEIISDQDHSNLDIRFIACFRMRAEGMQLSPADTSEPEEEPPKQRPMSIWDRMKKYFS